MLEDAIKALQQEKKRANEQLAPALEKEQKRVVDMETEVAELQNKLSEETASSSARSQKLMYNLMSLLLVM